MKKKNKILLFILTFVLIVIGVYYFYNTFIEDEKALRTSGAMDALVLWAKKGASQKKTIPDMGYYDAYIYPRQI